MRPSLSGQDRDRHQRQRLAHQWRRRHWNYNLGTTAASTTLTVTNASGTVVYTGPGQTTAGNNSFTWNGQDNNGNQLPDGTYTLTCRGRDSSAQRHHQPRSPARAR